MENKFEGAAQKFKKNMNIHTVILLSLLALFIGLVTLVMTIALSVR